jgi:hypothetical protein
MNVACVIGNGPSRLQFDLHHINALMTTYGCNALYRDFIPNYLISMDYNMVDEILKKNVHKQCNFYTQHDNRVDKLATSGEPINFFWGFKETNDSGNSALRLALRHDNSIVYIIGFDYNIGGSSLPNVYSGTKNYCNGHVFPAASMQATRWRQRLRKILNDHTNKKVIRVNGNNNSIDINTSNYAEITVTEFNNILKENK